jgi:CubicO group peptidase (beta-lactamase class C family)
MNLPGMKHGKNTDKILTLLVALPALALLLVAAEPEVTEAQADALPITGKDDPRLASFDRMMVAFVKQHKVSGATLAVAKDDRLVYARGFGYADMRRKEATRPNSLMRIASVSKPITAAAILLLVQQGKLKLTDHVWDLLKELEAKRDPHGKIDSRWKVITVLEALQHTGGWDRAQSFDPMFRSVMIARALHMAPPAQARDVVRYMMGQPLDFDPGQRYAYSNFGYCVLGRVIEEVSGQTYEQFAQRQVLAKLGIMDMQIGKTPAGQRAAREVTYYAPNDKTGTVVVGPELGKKVPLPYGAWYLEAMDAHGGWIASAPDLVRFGAALNRPGRLLHGQSLMNLVARPRGQAGLDKKGKPSDVYYGCGWRVRLVGQGRMNTWHTGRLDGTESLLARRWDGLTWAVLFNTSAGGKLAGDIDPLLHRAADQVKIWPAEDLYGTVQ